MKIYIVRHGESETNVQKKWTGWLDALLTEKGISDAKRAGELLSNIVFDKVYASDLSRAVQTAKTALPNCEIETNFLLREIDVGSFAGQPLNNLSSFSEEQLKNYNTTAFKAFGGESLQDFNLRIKAFMEILEKSDYENVAIFTHRGWQLSLLDLIFGVYVPRKKVFLGNCAVMTVEFTGEFWRLVGVTNLD